MLDEKYLEHKIESSYSAPMNHEIQLLSVSKDDLAIPFGSAIYRVQQFPGDIDLIENITWKGSENEVLDKFIEGIKNVVQNVTSSKLHYYSEIKAGLDVRYEIDIGRLDNGVYSINPNLPKIVEDYYNNDLFSEGDYLILLIAMRGKGANDYDVIFNVIREYRVLRWTAKEILSETKQVRGKTISLKEVTLSTDTLFKIDEITIIQDKFVEVTNVYFLSFTDSSGTTKEILDTDVEIQFGLRKSIEELYYSDLFYNPFKMIKRMFALSQTMTNRKKPQFKNLLEKIIPFVSSTTSLAYQIKSELESIRTVLEVSKSIPYATINSQVDSMKFRLSNYLEIPNSVLKIINAQIDAIVDTNDVEDKSELISDVISILKRYIARASINYMNKVGINPPPVFVLPDKMIYNKNIIREANIMPTNPIKKLNKYVDANFSIEK